MLGAVRDLVRFKGQDRVAVEQLDLSIDAGEAVALIGPNGAGKSTTIKMLTGILKPTSGTLSVGGLNPWADRIRHVRQIGVVFGQRTQLWWDLAVIEALDLTAAMFGVPDAVYRKRLAHFDEVLGIGPLLRTPVRQLSLGERMRCELAAALMHAPPILFLDEPTIGLDIAVKLRLRAFLTELRDRGDTTMVLTTHDLDDVAALCPRVMVLAEGKLLHDGPLPELAARLGGRRTLRVELRDPLPVDGAWLHGLDVVEQGPTWARLTLADDAPTVVATVLARAVAAGLTVADLHLQDPPIESLIAQFYERSP